jgi:hypothetical protein
MDKIDGWGKPAPAARWHRYTGVSGDPWAIVSLCGKWRGEITAGGVFKPHLYPEIPADAVYPACSACTRHF